MTTSTETIRDSAKTIECKLHFKKLSLSVGLEGLSQLFSQLKNPAILGGNSAKTGDDKFSYWAADPREVFEFKTSDKEPLASLKNVLNKYKLSNVSVAGLPEGIFCCGWIGYFSYDLNRYLEEVVDTAIDDLSLPLIRLCFYDRIICYDHSEDCFWLLALEMPDESRRVSEKLENLEALLVQAQGVSVRPFGPADLERIDSSAFDSNMSKDYYFDALEKINRYIYDGDVYQINFSQRFESSYQASAIDLYHWQNLYNPSPYAAFVDAGAFAIVSASPELFIKIQDGIISTKPIKGTRPRIDESGKLQEAEKTNAKNYNDLLVSEKEQAELNMIIDLERNDLGRICKAGTIKVVQPRTIEPYPTVFHALATIQGCLGEGVGFADVLKAVFPGGSITGAPKIRSMEIIDELEPTRRSVYTGSIGFIDLAGNASLNIAIRTVIIKSGRAFIQTGGGIVADSKAADEWDETLIKAKALLAGILAVQNK